MSEKKNKKRFSPLAPDNNQTLTRIEQLKLQINKGPLPPPHVIQQYDQVYPGAAKCIFETFQMQVNHRIELENKGNYIVNSL